MILSLDTETTGIDLFHGVRPYLVTTCDEENNVRFWEWDVDPLTREPTVVYEDLIEIQSLIDDADELVLQNSKFDYAALQTIFLGRLRWDWNKVRDTLLAGHLLHSGQPHDLTSMAMIYLGVDIQPFEDRLEEACNEARRIARRDFPEWRIAKQGLPEMPSAKEKTWKYDAWLPRILAEELGYKIPDGACEYVWVEWVCSKCCGHRWWVICSEYANADSSVTLPLWQAQRKELERRGLWAIYQERRKLLPVVPYMEQRGATFSMVRADELTEEFGQRSLSSRSKCVSIAKQYDYDLQMPKGASPNGSLRTFCFDVLKLEQIAGTKSKTAAPSLDKDAMAVYKTILDKTSDAGRFVHALLDGRGYDTSLAYMTGYRRYGIPVPGTRFLRLHPSFNPTGTAHLRWSCSNPNGQNIPRRDLDEEDSDVKTVRYLFGPVPGREWWSLDYANIELRIPAYESGEPAMVELFEKPDDPPYFGSYHLLNASIVYPRLFIPVADNKGEFKSKYKTEYQWCKNFGFALQYRCGEETGDRTAHVKGAWRAVKQNLPRMEALNDKWVSRANQDGYVETLPDKTVDPDRGYPIECGRGDWGRVSPTIPLNYHVSGTAMQAINKAMVRIHPLLDDWRQMGFDAFMALQVHDELVLDLPKGGKRNLPKINAIRRIMEQSGDDIDVPLKVSVSYHPNNWSDTECPK